MSEGQRILDTFDLQHAGLAEAIEEAIEEARQEVRDRFTRSLRREISQLCRTAERVPGNTFLGNSINILELVLEDLESE